MIAIAVINGFKVETTPCLQKGEWRKKPYHNNAMKDSGIEKNKPLPHPTTWTTLKQLYQSKEARHTCIYSMTTFIGSSETNTPKS